MKANDLMILAAAGLIGWFLIRKAVPAAPAVSRTASQPIRLEVPKVFASGGGWRPDGSYDSNLIDDQFREGWGYGD